MAVEAERLLAVFEARFTQLEKALDKARSNSSKTFSSMEKDGSRAETALANVGKTAQRTASVLDQVNKSLRIDTGGFGDRGADVAAYAAELDNLRAKFNPVFAASRQYEQELDELNRALSVGAVNATEHAAALDRLNGRYTALRGQATSATAVMSSARFETANVAAQFQDIAVTLAAGQSPFLIALQQGTQLTQVLGPAGLRGTVSLLGGAFASLVSPVSLVTLGLIAAGGYAVQYFASVMNNAGPTEATLREQASLIQQVADRWGDAVPALRAYADELQRANETEDLTVETQKAINAQFDEARRILPEVRTAIGEVYEALIRSGEASNTVAGVRDDFNEFDRAAQDLNTTLQEGGDATAAFARFSKELADLLENDSVRSSDALTDSVYRLRDAYTAAADEARRLAGDRAALAGRGDIPYSQFGGGRGSDPREIETEDYWRDRYFPSPERPTRGAMGGGRGSSVDDVDREREAVEQLIADLEFERSLIGSTAVEREKANALRRAGAAATDEERQYLEVLIEATHQQREGIEASEQAYRNLEQAGRTALNGIMSAFADGKIEAQEMLSIVGSLASQLFSMRRGGGGGGNWLSLLFGGFRANTSYGQFIGAVPGYANGTNSAPGGLAWVGERGKELVRLPRGSQVIPNEKLGGGSVVVNFSPMIDNRGASTEAVARTGAALAKLKAELPSHVIKAVREAKSGRVSF